MAVVYDKVVGTQASTTITCPQPHPLPGWNGLIALSEKQLMSRVDENIPLIINVALNLKPLLYNTWLLSLLFPPLDGPR